MAGIVGPVGLATLRQWSTKQAILDLSEKIEDSQFYNKFGASKESIDVLIDANTVTISRLMEIAPIGTIDPTASIYTTTMYACSGLLCVGLLSNNLIKAVVLHWTFELLISRTPDGLIDVLMLVVEGVLTLSNSFRLLGC